MLINQHIDHKWRPILWDSWFIHRRGAISKPMVLYYYKAIDTKAPAIDPIKALSLGIGTLALVIRSIDANSIDQYEHTAMDQCWSAINRVKATPIVRAWLLSYCWVLLQTTRLLKTVATVHVDKCYRAALLPLANHQWLHGICQ